MGGCHQCCATSVIHLCALARCEKVELELYGYVPHTHCMGRIYTKSYSLLSEMQI